MKFNKQIEDTNIDIQEAFDKVLRDGKFFNKLPLNIQTSSEFLSHLLFHYPSLFDDADKSVLEKDTELLKEIITEPIPSLGNHPFETLSLAHPKVLTRAFCLEMVEINPFNIKYVPEKFKYDSEFIETALIGDGMTVEFLPTYVKHSVDFGLMAVKSNGLSLRFFHDNVVAERDVILTALETKGFSLSQFKHPQIMCLDHEIAEKALKSDPHAIQFFTEDNPLIKDKYFAIKMIPYNAKFFSLFSEEIRHDPDTLLKIVNGKSVQEILYIVSQEYRLYPRFFLFALDAYQKCLTEEEKENNFGFYYYLHTSLFKERQKRFNMVYRRNMERKKQEEERERAELEKLRNSQKFNSESEFGFRPKSTFNTRNIVDEETPNIYQQEIELVSVSNISSLEEVDNSFIASSSETNVEQKNQQNNVVDNVVDEKKSQAKSKKSYKVQSQKDLTDFNSSIKSKNNVEDDDFSHLAMLAENLTSKNQDDNVETTNDKNDKNDKSNIKSEKDNSTSDVIGGFVAIGEEDKTIQIKDPVKLPAKTIDLEKGLVDDIYVNFQPQYIPKSNNSSPVNTNLLPEKKPSTHDDLIDLSIIAEDEPVSTERIEPSFEDMSPAQSAAKRAFPNRSERPEKPKSKQTVTPAKTVTTKKSSMSIFNKKSSN